MGEDIAEHQRPIGGHRMTSTDYRPVAAQPDKKSLAALIEQMKPEIARALPKHMTSDRMARIATTVLRQTPALGRCTPESFLGALMTASQLGLEPGPLGEAYLVPYGNTCTFIPGYRGLVKLARNSGQVLDLWAEIAYENDTFTYTLGLHRDIQHEVSPCERGKPTHVYAAAQLRDGGTPFVVMTVAEVEAIRSRSKAGKNGPWVTDWNAMAKKTVVKQLAKWLPLSSEFSTAAALDGSVRTEVDAELIDLAPDFIEGEVADEMPTEATE
ncbi:recombinase RecT [Mycobacterium sp. pUA109]|uniref:recombinase RecT n=1 Tax=Mycobacterium sp. pUA109 TaxID=3238982 RepID=UPI00351ABDC1